MVFDILSIIGGAGLSVALVALLARQLVLHRLSKDLEAFRSILNAEREKQLQSLRHEFEKMALEHQVTFQQVYAQRHDALKGLHRKLRETLDLCLQAAHSNGDPHVGPALDALQTLQQEVLSCEIYLPRDVCDRWMSLFAEMRSAVYSLREARGAQTQNWEAGRQELVRAVSDHAKAWRALNEKLVDDIREMIGMKK